jgi:folate-binding protein YgfZ
MSLTLHEFHARQGARFGDVAGAEVVSNYGNAAAEYRALVESAALLDLGFRGRVCVVGADRARFLHGQVTNDIRRLAPGQGCYALLTTNKGRLQADLNIHCLAEELLLDFEPGLTARVIERLEKFIVADDAQIADVAPHYGLLAVVGPRAAEAVVASGLFSAVPGQEFQSVKQTDATLGELYLANVPRAGVPGRDVFVPVASLAAVAERLLGAVSRVGGALAGWDALETARIEAGVPRFGADLDETTLPQEAGLEARAVSFQKGCYIGQEVINRLRTIGQVTRALRGLRLPPDLPALPVRGDKLWHAGKEVGHITSAVHSPRLNAPVALGYVRRECFAPGTELLLRTAAGEWPVQVGSLPVGG